MSKNEISIADIELKKEVLRNYYRETIRQKECLEKQLRQLKAQLDFADTLIEGAKGGNKLLFEKGPTEVLRAFAETRQDPFTVKELYDFAKKSGCKNSSSKNFMNTLYVIANRMHRNGTLDRLKNGKNISYKTRSCLTSAKQ